VLFRSPRRRAQARLRTETVRDEQDASALDDKLNQLELFILQQERETNMNGGEECPYDNCCNNESGAPQALDSSNGGKGDGPETSQSLTRLEKATEMWTLMETIRQKMHTRAYYLKANMASSPSSSSSATATATASASKGATTSTGKGAADKGAVESHSISIPVLPELPWITGEHTPHTDPVGLVTSELGGDKKDSKTTAAAPAKRKSIPANGKAPDTTTAVITFTKIQAFADVVDEVEAICKKETKELYAAEGKSLPPGQDVPESLKNWLLENREKLLGSNGYCERMTKHFWTQVERFEWLVGRKNTQTMNAEKDAEDEDGAAAATAVNPTGNNSNTTRQVVTFATQTTSTAPVSAVAAGGATLASHRAQGTAAVIVRNTLSAPTTCIRLVTLFLLNKAREIRITKEEKFMKVVRILMKGREKHERNLRPHLGSTDADAVRELTALNNLEASRSSDLSENVIKFRSNLVKELADLALDFVEDLGLCCVSSIKYLDSTFHQSLLHVPPGVEVPKKHLSAKRLRKVQRLKQAVEQGAEDKSRERVWPPVPTDELKAILEAAESMIFVEPPKVEAAPAVLETNVSKKDKGRKQSASKPVDIDVAAASATALMSPSWEDTMRTITAARGGVSTAHRTIVEERDVAIRYYVDDLSSMFDEIRAKYDTVLSDEQGWSMRWARQVEMLKSGSM